MYRIGVDIGGTFTDFAVWTDAEGAGDVKSFKVPSTPPDFVTGFRNGLETILDRFPPAEGEPVIVVHGTTVSTNAVIERNGSRIALLTTKGFRDVLELQRFKLLKPIDLFAEQTVPMIPRNHVYEINERLRSDGSVLAPIDRDEVVAAARRAVEDGATGLAVSFLHAYRNPVHELMARDAIRAALGPIDISLSSELWPKIGEYERTVVCVLNAYVKERMSEYLGQVKDYVAERLPGAQLFITRSNGGAMAVEEARSAPVQTLLSGPASGVTAAQYLNANFPDARLLTLDMGGTSTDLSLIQDGQPTVSTDAEVGEFPLSMPVTEIEAIGAGGGSIAWLDGRVLRVGPRSAGARPGPACFGRGGTLPTVTDAYLLCGYLNPDNFLGGRMKLDVARAEAAMAPIAEGLGLSIAAAASACLSVATSNMVASGLPFLARHGVDPEDVTLVLFGGGGGLHGPLLAAEIGIGRIIVPTLPSVYCAFGGVVTNLVHDIARSVHGETMTGETMRQVFNELAGKGREWLDAQLVEGESVAHTIEYWVDVRYVGQSFELTVPVSPAAVESADLDSVVAAFHAEHRRLYTHADQSRPLEFIEMRIRIRGELPAPPGGVPVELPSSGDSITGRRTLRFEDRVAADVAVHDRTRIGLDTVITGPAVIEQSDTTILVPPGYVARCAKTGELVMSREA